PWSGLWYVNVGEGPSRAWEDMRRYGFIAAGAGERYSRPLERLQTSDHIVAYQAQAGYVGYGTVTSPATMVADFETGDGPLLDQPLTQPGLSHDQDDRTLAEHAVGIEWIKTVSITDAKRFDGIFANQNIVCKLRDPETIAFLQEQFGFSLAQG
ncbi:unnamed protein product, partial [marine sediment metagenome]